MQTAPDESTSSRATPWIERIEWSVAILLSSVALFLFVVRATHAGSLWRDEAESVQSAQMPLPEMLDAIQYSSFPILFPLVVRTHTTLFGASDFSLRGFGLAVGILLLATSWLPIRRLAGNVPLLLLAVIGLNANFLIAGLSLRGYGIGSLFILLAFVCTVGVLRKQSFWTSVAVFLSYLGCLQCLFLNAPLALSIAIAVVCVLLLRREAKRAWPIAAIVFVSALSYGFYVSQFYGSGRIWAKILQVPISFHLIWQSFAASWSDNSVALGIWLSIIATSIGAAIWRYSTSTGEYNRSQRELLLSLVLLVPLSIIASYLFVRVLPRPPDQRYFLSLTIVVAAAVDLLWANFPVWLRAARIILVLTATLALPFSLWPALLQAESNAATVAKMVEQHADPGDLIVVNPWSYGVSFNWYYHGAARWITVPRIDDHRIHRYDLVLPKMEATAPLADVEEEIASTLQSGSRVWFAGQLELPPPGEPPVQLGSAPDPKFGWLGSAYRKAWSQQLGVFLWQHVPEISLVDTGTEQTISPRENFAVYQLEGWKY